MSRVRLFPVVAVAAVSLAACQPSGDVSGPSGPSPSGATTSAAETSAAPSPETSPTSVTASERGRDGLGGLAAVTVGGAQASVVDVCAGVDGAVVVSLESGGKAMLVRERGLEVRYQSGDVSADTSIVEVDEGGPGVTYTAMFDGEAVPGGSLVVLTVADGAHSEAPDCGPEGHS